MTLNLLKEKNEPPEEPLPKAKHRTKQPNDLNFDVRTSLYEIKIATLFYNALRYGMK